MLLHTQCSNMKVICSFFQKMFVPHTPKSALTKPTSKHINADLKHPLSFEEHAYDSFYEETNWLNGGAK